VVLLSSKHEKSRPITSDFSIVYAIYHQMVTIIYLPMHYLHYVISQADEHF